MNTTKLNDAADYGEARLLQLNGDEEALNGVNSRIQNMFDRYAKVVKNLISKMRNGTADQLKKAAKDANGTKHMLKGIEASIKKTEYIGEVFDKYAALIDELVAQISMCVKNTASRGRRTRRRSRVRN